MTKPDMYAVFGHPIKHSQSPQIHSLFAQQTKQNLSYTAVDVPPEQFESKLRDFIEKGGKGLNCTLPLKELAYQACLSQSERAMRAKAVNTIIADDQGKLYGDNTDGLGLIRDLTVNHKLQLAGQRILILGAGGATRGILAPLLEADPDEIVIANRTPAKAKTLSEEFASLGKIRACGLSQLNHSAFNLIINATPASLKGDTLDLSANLLAQGGICYDLAYAKEPTTFVQWGVQQGAYLSLDGIGMLVEQAAEAFHLWRGIRPDTQPILKMMRG